MATKQNDKYRFSKETALLTTKHVRIGQQIYDGPWLFNLESPIKVKQADKFITIRGWYVPAYTESNKVALRLITPDKKVTKPIQYGFSRPDVKKYLRNQYLLPSDGKVGFAEDIIIEYSGLYSLETKDAQNGWQTLCTFELDFEPEKIYSDYFNPRLAENQALHENLIANIKSYHFQPANPSSFERAQDDPKLIAFYLPQFHPIPENNKWWGEGFTEWSNVATAQPQFSGHLLPKVPTDLGYYDLRQNNVIESQIKLAKKYGIYAFCFYYYWFSGRKLLDTPINTFVANKEWDFNFMICWANENWTRRWDGRNSEVLIKQKHCKEDPINFIRDVEHILVDPRYTRVNNKPVLLVYRPSDLNSPQLYAKVWRDYFQQKHGLDLHLVAVQSFDTKPIDQLGFDKSLEFNPLILRKNFRTGLPIRKVDNQLLNKDFSGHVVDYRRLVNKLSGVGVNPSTYSSIMPAWDNSARRKVGATIFHNATPELYGSWLDSILKQRRLLEPAPMVFINAWNEWGEGAYLEPDAHYGHAILNKTAEVQAMHSSNKINLTRFPFGGLSPRPKGIKLAIIVHLYYTDTWPLIAERLSLLSNQKYSLYISMPLKNQEFEKIIKDFKNDAHIFIVPNQGRDVLPFLMIARKLDKMGYEYVLKLHSKRSVHRVDGSAWMLDLLTKLVPSNSKILNQIILKLEEPSTSLIGPDGHFISLLSYLGSNRELIEKTIREIKNMAKNSNNNVEHYGFFAGTMFWARLESIRPLLDLQYTVYDFDVERGQVDGTLAHALERVLSIIPQFENKIIYIASNHSLKRLSRNSTLPVYNFAVPEISKEKSSSLPQSQLMSIFKVRRVIKNATKIPSYYKRYGMVTAKQTAKSIMADRFAAIQILKEAQVNALPKLKFVSTSLDKSPQVQILTNIATSLNRLLKHSVDFHTFTPCMSNIVADLSLTGIHATIHLDRNITLDFNNGDVLYLNTADFKPLFKYAIFKGLESGVLGGLVWLIPVGERIHLFKHLEDETFLALLKKNDALIVYVDKLGKMHDISGKRITQQYLLKWGKEIFQEQTIKRNSLASSLKFQTEN